LDSIRDISHLGWADSCEYCSCFTIYFCKTIFLLPVFRVGELIRLFSLLYIFYVTHSGKSTKIYLNIWVSKQLDFGGLGFNLLKTISSKRKTNQPQDFA